MEGFCRASSPLSIADCRTRFNAKCPENRGFSYYCVTCLSPVYSRPRLKYFSGEGLSGIPAGTRLTRLMGNGQGVRAPEAHVPALAVFPGSSRQGHLQMKTLDFPRLSRGVPLHVHDVRLQKILR